MTTAAPPPAVGDWIRAAVRELADSGASLKEIEDIVLEGAPLDEERRAAAWLYAWCSVERAREAWPPAA